MKCSRCKEKMSQHHVRNGHKLCGCCQLVGVSGRTFGVQSASLVPAHFNQGLGEYIEDYDHLKKRRKALKDEGKISAWD